MKKYACFLVILVAVFVHPAFAQTIPWSQISNKFNGLPYYNVKLFGAKGNGVMKFDGAMTSGSAVLNSAGAAFATADVGKRVVVTGAGASGASLVTTIASRTSATQVTLSATASTTVSSTKYHYGNDDRAAIISAISAIQAAGNGTLFFPGGLFEVSDSLFITKSIRILGAGMAGGMANQISGGVLAKDRLGPVQYNTVLLMCDNSKNGFVFDTPNDTKPHVKISDIHFEGDGAGKNTAGAFVVVKGMNQDMVIESTSFYGGFLQVDVQSAFHYHIDKCVFSAPAKAGLKTGNNIRTDTGDMSVTSSVFVPGTFATAALGTMAIWWYAGGGMKIIGCKFDASSFLTTTMFKYLVYCSNTLDATSDIIITANSFENWQVSAIKLEGIVDPYVRNIHITSNQFAASGSTGPCIDIDSMRDLIISDFLIRDWGGTVNQPAIKVTNCDYVTIGKGQIKDYTTNINTAGSANIDIDYKWQTGQIGQAFTYPGVWSFVNNIQYSDNFSRADNSSSLGNLSSPNTVAWIPAVGTWGISNNQAYCSSALGSGSTIVNIAYVDYASGNCSVEVDLTSVGGGISEKGVIFRYLDANNFWMLDVTLSGTTRNEVLYKKVAGGAFQSVAAASDLGQSPGTATYKVVLSNNVISVYRDGVGIPELTNVVDNFNQLQTKMGMMVVSGSGYVGTTPRIDNFKVY